MAILVGMSDEVKGQHFDLDETELTIGRAPENTIAINSGSVSGSHCRVFCNEGRYFLEDLNSTNGSRINGIRTTGKVKLNNKNLIQVGSIEFLYEDENAENDDTAYLNTDVEVDTESVAAPKSFTNISPFNTRKKESKKGWHFLIVLIVLMALAGICFFFWTILNTK